MMKRCNFLLFPVLVCLLLACSNSDKTKLGIAPVSNITCEAGNGSILFRWSPPDVPIAYTDISYVDANANVRRILVDGKLSQALVNGFSDSETHEFHFVTYNTRGTASEPIVLYAAAQEPLVNIFNGKVRLTTDLGGVHVFWDNEYGTEFYVEIRYADVNGNDFTSEILIPANHTGTQFVSIASKITGTQAIDVHVTTTDVYGNTSPETIVKFFKIEAGKLDRTRWSVADFSSEETSGEGTSGRAKDVLDGLASTYWHSRWTGSAPPAFPHYLTFDLGARKRLEEADLQNRQSTLVRAGEIQFDGNNQSTEATAPWVNFASITMDPANQEPQRLVFPNPVEYRYVKIRFTTAGTGNTSTSAALAEFNLYGTDIVE